jgi:glycosyltransferase involved in cell wall biosynthesis
MNPAELPEPRVCVVNAGWPRVSTTFIAQELVGLEREGLGLWLATYGRSDTVRHALDRELRAPVHRLPKRPRLSIRFLSAWLRARRLPGYARARAFLDEELADGSRKRALRAFARGLVLANEMPDDVGMIYAHFIDRPTSIAIYAGLVRGVPVAASAHAKDIWTTPDSAKRRTIRRLDWITTCTGPGADHLSGLTDEPDKVHLIRHGLSFDRFPEDPPARPRRDGSSADDPVRLLSVGRAVEKKGFDVLLDALAQLPRELAWEWHHVGQGRILDRLKARADELGLGGRIVWHGAREQGFVIERYRDCDLFVLPSREGGDGDRDGLPNVLMEAQSQALACLSTDFSAIPELIVDGETGLLVPPGDMPALRDALERLIRSPEERQRLGTAGYRRVRSHFQAESGIREIAALLRNSMARGSSDSRLDRPR